MYGELVEEVIAEVTTSVRGCTVSGYSVENALCQCVAISLH